MSKFSFIITFLFLTLSHSTFGITYEWERDVDFVPIMQWHTWRICVEEKVDYDVILSIMKAESMYDIHALNTANANGTHDYGLMQINSSNTKWVNELAGEELNLDEPLDNIRAGVLIYRFYRDYWVNKGVEGDDLLRYTVNSYNMGIGGYKSTGLISRGYDRKIFGYYDEIRGDLE